MRTRTRTRRSTGVVVGGRGIGRLRRGGGQGKEGWRGLGGGWGRGWGGGGWGGGGQGLGGVVGIV